MAKIAILKLVMVFVIDYLVASLAGQGRAKRGQTGPNGVKDGQTGPNHAKLAQTGQIGAIWGQTRPNWADISKQE